MSEAMHPMGDPRTGMDAPRDHGSAEGAHRAVTPAAGANRAFSPAEGAHRAFVALGSNLGDREAFLAAGRAGIAALPGTRIVAESAVAETVPLGPLDQGPYLNQMVVAETPLSPLDLLDALLAVERANGRERAGERWSARTLDLDIVLYDEMRIALPRLTVPHPEICNRAFWQHELAELGHPDYPGVLFTVASRQP